MQPSISYLVCGTPRCGSTLLCEALINTGIAGEPEEYFQQGNERAWQKCWGSASYADYLARTIEQCTTPNGVFGVKMMWGYFDHFMSRLRQLPEYKDRQISTHTLLQSIFPNLHYIWIKRRDTVRQAISLAKARQTNTWAVKAEATPQPAARPVFSFMQIDLMIKEIQAHEAAWQEYFAENDIHPVIVIYEDLVKNYEETALHVLQRLEIAGAEHVEFAPRTLKKQADAESEQWVQRYLQLKSEHKHYRLLSRADEVFTHFLCATRFGLFLSRKRS